MSVKGQEQDGGMYIICVPNITHELFFGNFSLKVGGWEEYKILVDSSLNIISLVNIDFLS